MWLQDFVYNSLNKLIKSRFYTALMTLAHGDLEYRIMRINQFCLSTAKLHEKAFAPFKNKFAGREVAVIACGPSVKDYEPLPGVINIGVNRAYKNERIECDFLFIQDGRWPRQDMQEVNGYRAGTCTKFYGLSSERLHNDFPAWIVSESDVVKANAYRFRTDNIELVIGKEPEIPLDISTQPLADFQSVVFSALQFALWTNPKRIYLVGCDCSNSGYFYSKKSANDLALSVVLDGYKKLKAFATAFYPDTEIVSVNPVGLKGLFKDVYQAELNQ